jgi:hypothetical protein
MFFKLIASLLFVGVVGACTSLPKRSPPPTDAFLKVASADHQISVHGNDLHVISAFKVIAKALPKKQLLLQVHDKNAKPEAVMVTVGVLNQRALPLAGADGVYAVEIPETIPSPSTIIVSYKLRNALKNSDFNRITTYSLIYPARNLDSSVEYELVRENFFSFDRQIPTRFKLEGISPKSIAIGSSRSRQDKSDYYFDEANVGRFGVVIADAQSWQKREFKVDSTTFIFLNRRHKPVLASPDVVKSVSEVWPRFKNLFGAREDYVVLVDSDWEFISGGLLASNIIGIFGQNRIHPEESEGFAKDIGWKSGPSTRTLIERNYKGPNSWGRYVTGMVAHELAHLYFGFGQTTERASDIHDLWLSLGMGMVYDRLVTVASTGQPDQFFETVEQKWKTQFAANVQIDQRLINPDTSNDRKFELSRAHIYAHGKSSFILRDLRDKMGEEKFDEAVRDYLRRGAGGYKYLRPLFLERYADLPKWESDWQVGWKP